VRLNDAASGTGRSLNKEIVDRLEQSFAVAPEAAPVRINGEEHMHRWKSRRTILVLAAVVAALAAALGGLISSGRTHDASRTQIQIAQKQIQRESQGTENGGPGGESNEYLTAQRQFAEARTAPTGLVDPGAYSAAVGALNALAPVGGAWDNITAVKYDADHPAYRDYFSNSSGGSGLVTGRITGLAADDQGHVYAAGADGGVWRSVSGGGGWVSIADSLPTLSSGDLEIAPDGALWYATGEANTGGTSYVGSGVYRLTNPATGTFTPATRVGGDELESTTIGKLRFGGGKVWAATLRGVWSHSATSSSGTWTLSFAPNPQNLPASLKPFAQTTALADAIGTGSSASDTNAPYKNIANDVAVDPKNANHVVAAIAWRSGDAYNGFYETSNAGLTWTKVNPTGAIPANDIGYVTFAFAKDGSKLYAINQSPTLLNKVTGTVNSLLDGIYVSNNGSPAGPWSRWPSRRSSPTRARR